MSSAKLIQGDYLIENQIIDETVNTDRGETVIRTKKLTVDGDFSVTGDTTVIDVEQISIADPMVELNSRLDDDGNQTIIEIPDTPMGSGNHIAGLVINRGLLKEPDGSVDENSPPRVNVEIRYNDNTASGDGTFADAGIWEATSNGVDYFPLYQAEGFKLVDDLDPHLGGDLVVNGFKITAPADLVELNYGDLVLQADRDVVIQPKQTNSEGKVKIDSVIELENTNVLPSVSAGYNQVYANTTGSGGTGFYFNNGVNADEFVSRKKAIVFGLIF